MLKKNQFNALVFQFGAHRSELASQRSGTLILLLIISALPQLTDDHFSLLICFPSQGAALFTQAHQQTDAV